MYSIAGKQQFKVYLSHSRKSNILHPAVIKSLPPSPGEHLSVLRWILVSLEFPRLSRVSAGNPSKKRNLSVMEYKNELEKVTAQRPQVTIHSNPIVTSRAQYICKSLSPLQFNTNREMSVNNNIIGQLSDLCHTNTYSSSFTINNESNYIQKEYKVGQLSMYNTKQLHDSVMLLSRRYGTEVTHGRYVNNFGLGLSSKMRCWDRRNRLKECRHLWCRLWATSSSTISLRMRWWSGSYRHQDYDADG